jgi:isoquinoline 1-oxidoreductase alpha subunit
METYTLTVNGQPQAVTVDPGTPLLWVLREDLKMTGTKYGCGIAACGACTVHVGGVATRSCVVPISLIGDRPIVTIEAMAADPVGRAVQDAWVSHDVVQCGYCQSGQIMSAVALLKSTPKPTDTNIEEAMGGNLCRCGTYVRIREAGGVPNELTCWENGPSVIVHRGGRHDLCTGPLSRLSGCRCGAIWQAAPWPTALPL